MPAETEMVDPQTPVPTPIPENETDDAALIEAYTREAEIPAPLEKWYKAFDRDRAYVNDDCMVLDSTDAVGTNHILRNQYTVMALLASRNADISINVGDAVWEPQPEFATDPMTGQPMLDPMTGQPAIIGELPGEPPPELGRLAHTMEVLARRLLMEARFRQQLAGAVQDVETNAVMFIKVNQQEDYKKDPLGNFRFNDQQDNYALYRHWSARVASGDIVADSAEHKRFQDLETTIRGYLVTQIMQDLEDNPPAMGPVDPMTGLPLGPPMMDPRQETLVGLQAGTGPIDMEDIPEVAHWVGFPIDFVNPEDIRFDGDITRPEDFWRAMRVQHRVYMDVEAAAAKFGLTPEEAKRLPKAKSSTGTAKSAGGEASSRNDALTSKSMDTKTELWECWDRQTNKVSVYAIGFPRFLHKYTPTVVWRNWFPIIPFLFNRVTGRFVGVSSTTLQRPAQEEINLMRTLDRHAKKACFPRILVRKGTLQPGEKAKYKRARPYEVIELETPDELNDAIKETAAVTYNPQLTDSSRAETDLQRMSGTSLVAGGTVGVSKSATETATAQQGTEATADYRRGIIEDLYNDVVTCVLDLAARLLPEQNVKALAGPGAFWPDRGLEDLWRNLQVTIRAGSTGKPDTDKRLGWATNMIQVARNLGLMAKGPQILDYISREAGVFDRISEFFQIAPMPPMGMGAPGAPPGGPGAPPATGGSPPSPPKLDSQQGQGGGGGKPMSGAPTPDSIPNRPQV